MTITLELTPEEEKRLKEKATRAGLAPADYLRRFIDADGPFYDPAGDPAFSSEWSEDDLADATRVSLSRWDKEASSNA